MTNPWAARRVQRRPATGDAHDLERAALPAACHGRRGRRFLLNPAGDGGGLPRRHRPRSLPDAWPSNGVRGRAPPRSR